MKKLLCALLIISILGFAAACTNTDMNTPTPKQTEQAEQQNITFDYEKVSQGLSSLTYEENGQTLPIFPSMSKANNDNIKEVFGIDSALLDDYYISIATNPSNPSTYMILKPKEGKTDEVKKQVNEYFDNHMMTYGTTSTQYSLIKNRLQNEYQGYLIYIVSSNNQLAYDTIVNMGNPVY